MDTVLKIMIAVGIGLVLWGLGKFGWHVTHAETVTSTVPEIMQAQGMSWIRRLLAAALEGWTILPGIILVALAWAAHTRGPR